MRPTQAKGDEASSSEVRLFILGAGCSLRRYPLAKNMLEHLKDFNESLTNNAGAVRLRRLVHQTVNLFERLRERGAVAQTLDDLAWLVHQGTLADNSLGTNHLENDRLVQEAKTAVAAMFLAKEAEAVNDGLIGYRNLLRHVFPTDLGTDYRLALRRTPNRVVTFNYDRLFELAFRVHFPSYDSTDAPYCPAVLNSGLYQALPRRVEVDLNRFSYLKLHGSVGLYSYEEAGECAHRQDTPDPTRPVPITDEKFFVPPGQGIHSNKATPALVVFPHEKDFLNNYADNQLPYRFYIPEVWKAAHHFASQAKEIWIVGYSCPKPDFSAWSSLLTGAAKCRRIVVWDPCAKEICEKRIKPRLPNLAKLLDPVDGCFEEF